MKKGSFSSKLISPFFILRKFSLPVEVLLTENALIHHCRFLPRGGGCLTIGFSKFRCE